VSQNDWGGFGKDADTLDRRLVFCDAARPLISDFDKSFKAATSTAATNGIYCHVLRDHILEQYMDHGDLWKLAGFGLEHKNFMGKRINDRLVARRNCDK
jgi:hypothetical protein